MVSELQSTVRLTQLTRSKTDQTFLLPSPSSLYSMIGPLFLLIRSSDHFSAAAPQPCLVTQLVLDEHCPTVTCSGTISPPHNLPDSILKP